MNTTYFLNQIIGNVFHVSDTPALPSTYYIGLSTAAPTIDGVNTGEPSFDGTGYTRILLSNLATPVNGVTSNTAPIYFNESLSNWGLVTHYTVYDAPTGGNLLFYGPLELSRTIETNTAVIIRAGELSIELCNDA